MFFVFRFGNDEETIPAEVGILRDASLKCVVLAALIDSRKRLCLAVAFLSGQINNIRSDVK
jgi:hypothetical protein